MVVFNGYYSLRDVVPRCSGRIRFVLVIGSLIFCIRRVSLIVLVIINNPVDDCFSARVGNLPTSLSVLMIRMHVFCHCNQTFI